MFAYLFCFQIGYVEDVESYRLQVALGAERKVSLDLMCQLIVSSSKNSMGHER